MMKHKFKATITGEFGLADENDYMWSIVLREMIQRDYPNSEVSVEELP